MRRNLSLLLLFIIIFFSLLPSGCESGDSLDSRFNSIVNDYRFSLVTFHLEALGQECRNLFTENRAVTPEMADEVTAYFDSSERDETARQRIEAIIELQVKEAYREADINNPFLLNRLQGTFPPVNFYLDEPPLLVVISPRDHIERYREALLLPDMTLDDIEAMESALENLGYSALVIRLGGVATYPSYISSNMGLASILETGAEEWLHQYLAFTPLGFRYVLHLLGIQVNHDIVTMNETVAGIVSQEIGHAVYSRYYSNLDKEPEPQNGPTFDFNAAMRETRLTVDAMLEQGEIDTAESYMNNKRDYIEANGYYIRKLNQAYFAFHGSYTDEPSSVDPIGESLNTLRLQSISLKEFLDMVAEYKNVQSIPDFQP